MFCWLAWPIFNMYLLSHAVHDLAPGGTCSPGGRFFAFGFAGRRDASSAHWAIAKLFHGINTGWFSIMIQCWANKSILR